MEAPPTHAAVVNGLNPGMANQLMTREGLAQKIQSMLKSGVKEQDNQELRALMNIVRAHNISMGNVGRAAPQQQGPTAQEDGEETIQLTLQQMATFRCQVMAYRHLRNNNPIPKDIQQALNDPNFALTLQKSIPTSPAKEVAQTSEVPEEMQPATVTAPPKPEMEIVYDDSSEPEDTSSSVYPYNALISVRDAQMETRQRKRDTFILPNLLPPGLDIRAMQEERQRFLDARIRQRLRELNSLPSTMPDEFKRKALIEQKSLMLLSKQRQLREDVLKGMQQTTTLSLIADRTAFKRLRKPTTKDSRNIESFERKQKADREKRAKQKLTDRLDAVAKHGSALKEANLAAAENAAKMGRSVLRFHQDAERAEKARVERVSKERLRALKNDDEEAYLRLIDTAKDTRITHLLRQTDSFLDGLSKSVMAQQKAAGAFKHLAANEPPAAEEAEMLDERAFGAAPVFEDDTAEQGKVDYYNVAHRIKETINDQPKMLVGGTLKSYQIKGLQWMISLVNNRLNGILADEMGLGKTIQSIALITYMIETKRIAGPYLIIVPLSTIPNWISEFDRWAPGVKVLVYKGGPAVRRQLGEEMRRPGSFQVCLTTYEFIIRDRINLARPSWAHMIIDEGHRLKNTQSKLSLTLAQYYKTQYRLILTGTPLQNNLPELWALLNFVLPKVFNSVQSFDEWFNTPFANTGGQDKIALNEEESLLVIRRLHKVLRPFLLRRLKKDVEADLPDKVERIIRCKMSALQLKLYKQMKDHGVLVIDDQTGKSKQSGLKGLQNTIMQLRKICNHPFVYQAVENSVKRPHQNEELLYRVAGKFELLDRILPKLFATGHRVLMFFQMTQIMDIMQDYLAFRNTPNLRLDGGTPQDTRGEIMRQFNAPDCPYNIFLLSTRAGGLGLNLQTADTVILYDSDWNPHQDLQAQDRAHRIGQKKEVRIFRLVTSQSVEEHIVATANLKKDMDSKVIQAGKFDNNSTNAEREEHLRAILEATIEEEDMEGDYTDAELNEILMRGDAEFELFQQMDADRRRGDEAVWRARGNTGPVPERLFQDYELPPIYRVEPVFDVKEADPVFDEVTGRRKRQAANNVHYNDGLSEEAFLKAAEGGELQDVIQAKRAKKDLKRQKRLQALIDDAGSPASSSEAGRSNRSRIVDSDEDSDDNSASEDERADSRKRGRPSTVSVEPSLNEDDDEPKSKRRKTAVNTSNGAAKAQGLEQRAAYKKIIEAVKAVLAPEGYEAAGLFLELPSKREYPDYYSLIRKPVSLKQISAKINKGTYGSLMEMRADFELMVRNANEYNDPSSTVCRDANSLLAEFDAKAAELAGPPSARPSTVPDSDDDSVEQSPVNHQTQNQKFKLTFAPR